MRRDIIIISVIMTLSGFLTGAASPLRAHDVKGERFLYDGAARLQNGTMLDGENLYEPSAARVGDRIFVAMLEFSPGEGDRIVVGELKIEELRGRRVVTEEPGQYRNPTLTAASDGELWLSYEMLAGERWGIHVRKAAGELEFGEPRRVSSEEGSDINHSAAAFTDGGIALVWQGDRNGQWDVVFRVIDSRGEAAKTRVLSSNPLGDWHPKIAASGHGECTVVWDAYDGESFSVRARTFDGRKWGKPVAVTDTKAFEGRPAVTYDAGGRIYLSWEEGAINWGKEYRGSLREADKLNDVFGPLHRFLLLRVARLSPAGEVRRLALPLPTVEVAAAREGAVAGRERLGVYYERGQLAVDGANRLWVVYRHYYYPEVALPGRPTSHVEEGWRLYARCYEEGKWSELFALEPNQRDGMQRLSVAPEEDGLVALWATGRTHRGEARGPRGVAAARIVAGADLEFVEAGNEIADVVSLEKSGGTGAREPDFAPATVGGTDYGLFMGDLHRHTDLSLCRAYFDGSLDDVYRYAIEAGELDFLGVTDHCRDIGNGDAQSQLWWRSIKEVTRHRLDGAFFPLFAFERSHGETDHNVISLRNDMLRPYQPPLKEFWELMDADTITIPHNPIRPFRAFAYQDDEKRPLLEIYQGCRDNPMQAEAHAGLGRGYHMGFIASSDHMATRTSFACVWSPRGGEEPIFRSLQARRTYGATAKIRLVFRSETRWMGEVIEAMAMPVFQFEVDGTAPIARLDIYRDGEVAKTIENVAGGARLEGEFRGPGEFGNSQYFYVHVVQEDGEQAWSSPIWVERVK